MILACGEKKEANRLRMRYTRYAKRLTPPPDKTHGRRVLTDRDERELVDFLEHLSFKKINFSMREVLRMVSCYTNNRIKPNNYNFLYDLINRYPEKLMKGKGGRYIPRGRADSNVIDACGAWADMMENYLNQCVRKKTPF